MKNPTTHVMLSPELAEEIKDALTACTGQLEYLGDPGESTRMCIEAGEAALQRFREAREQAQADASAAGEPVPLPAILTTDGDPTEYAGTEYPTHPEAAAACVSEWLTAGGVIDPDSACQAMLATTDQEWLEAMEAVTPDGWHFPAETTPEEVLAALAAYRQAVEAEHPEALERARRHHREGARADAERPQAAEVMSACLETFGGPLRLATICLEEAGDADLDSLSRHHTLALAVAVDDWKTRAEVRMIEFEQAGPERSGTG